MRPIDFITRLREAGLVGDGEIRLVPLRGGVSSDIHLVETTAGKFVVKAALAKLRVSDDWFADVSRNAIEQDYLGYAAQVVPDSVPRLLGGNRREGWFAMEYLGDGFRTWKDRLMAANAQAGHAERAGEVLGRLHRASWGDPVARARFATLRNFHALRIEPYLLTTAQRLPAAQSFLIDEANRLATAALALVHGDYSPKNLLIGGERLVVLDAECAWFGDPAFDTAFLLTHLHLKALLHAAQPEPMLALVPAFWRAYANALGPSADAALEARTVRLLLSILLARVHGKSPVEYLAAPQRELVTTFVLSHIKRPMTALAEFTAAWRDCLSTA